jgi:hypothetical protein
MDDLTVSITTLSQLYFAALSKGNLDFANEIKKYLIELIEAQNQHVLLNLRRLQSYHDL